MRRPSLWVLATSLFVFGAARSARAEGNDLTGQRAPEINVQEGVQGIATGTSLAAYRGEVVVLKFWFTRCPACRRSLPEFQTLYQRFAPRGVRFLAIAYDETSNVRTYLRSTGFTFPVAIDGGGVTATRYGVFTYPTTYVIGADGIVKAYDQLSAALLERELDAARATPRPGAARRPLASFPRPNAAAPAPGSPLPGEATPTTASVGTPETPHRPALTAAAPPAAPVPAVAAVPPPIPASAQAQAPTPRAAAGSPGALPPVPPASAVPAVPPAPPAVAAPLVPDVPAATAVGPAALAALPIEPAVPAAPLPTDPALAGFPEPGVAPGEASSADRPALPPVAPVAARSPLEPALPVPESLPTQPPAAAPSLPPSGEPALPAARVEGDGGSLPTLARVESGSVAPSAPVSGGQPPSRDSLVIPPDPAATVPAPAVRADLTPSLVTVAETAPMPTPPVGPPALTEVAPSASPAAAPAPFLGAADLIAAGDYPGVLRLVESYASAHPDGAAWAPADLAEARRLEQIVRAKYLEQNDAARVRWAQRETEPALEAARALESAYRGTALERSAADLVRWFEANRTAASR